MSETIATFEIESDSLSVTAEIHGEAEAEDIDRIGDIIENISPGTQDQVQEIRSQFNDLEERILDLEESVEDTQTRLDQATSLEQPRRESEDSEQGEEGEPEGFEEEFECRVCGKEFDNEAGRNIHEGRVHPDFEPGEDDVEGDEQDTGRKAEDEPNTGNDSSRGPNNEDETDAGDPVEDQETVQEDSDIPSPESSSTDSPEPKQGETGQVSELKDELEEVELPYRHGKVKETSEIGNAAMVLKAVAKTRGSPVLMRDAVQRIYDEENADTKYRHYLRPKVEEFLKDEYVEREKVQTPGPGPKETAYRLTDKAREVLEDVGIQVEDRSTVFQVTGYTNSEFQALTPYAQAEAVLQVLHDIGPAGAFNVADEIIDGSVSDDTVDVVSERLSRFWYRVVEEIEDGETYRVPDSLEGFDKDLGVSFPVAKQDKGKVLACLTCWDTFSRKEGEDHYEKEGHRNWTSLRKNGIVEWSTEQLKSYMDVENQDERVAEVEA